MSFLTQKYQGIFFLFFAFISAVLTPLTIKAEILPHQDKIKIYNGVLKLFPIEKNKAAGLFVIQNDSNNDRLLRGITSSSCKEIVANHSNQEPINTEVSAQTDIFYKLAIPQHSVMVFPEAGYHFICRGLDGSVKPNEKVKFIFHFDENEDVAVDFTTSSLTASAD